MSKVKKSERFSSQMNDDGGLRLGDVVVAIEILFLAPQEPLALTVEVLTTLWWSRNPFAEQSSIASSGPHIELKWLFG